MKHGFFQLERLCAFFRHHHCCSPFSKLADPESCLGLAILHQAPRESRQCISPWAIPQKQFDQTAFFYERVLDLCAQMSKVHFLKYFLNPLLHFWLDYCNAVWNEWQTPKINFQIAHFSIMKLKIIFLLWHLIAVESKSTFWSHVKEITISCMSFYCHQGRV